MPLGPWTRRTPNCPSFEQDDSSYVIYVSGKKKGRGEENLFKRDGRKGKRFSSPLPFLYDVTGIVLLKTGTVWGLSSKAGAARKILLAHARLQIRIV